MAKKLLFRRDLAANWTSVDPTLAEGEPGMETDTGKFKIGDGVTAWTTLAYFVAGGGETNTASNVGAGGQGLFKQKVLEDLEFYNINSKNNKLIVTLDAANNEVDLEVDQTNINHDSLAAYDPNDHIDHTTVSVSPGDGLSGGGTIAATRTLDVDINQEAAVGTLALGDELLISDIDDSNNIKKTTVQDLVDLAPPGYTDEEAQDAVGNILTDTATIDFTYDDATPEITADVLPGGIDVSALDASSMGVNEVPFSDGTNLGSEADFTYTTGTNTLNVDNVDIDSNLNVTGFTELGDPGTEAGGINIGGTTYSSVLAVNDIGGTNPAQNVIHRHSTSLFAAMVGARSNSDTSAHGTVTSDMELFRIIGAGWTGSHYDIFGEIRMSASSSGTISATSSPGKVDIYTTPDGSNIPLVAMTLDEDQTATFAGTVDGRDIAADGTAQDSHIADGTIHFTEGSIDHDNINVGVTANPHTVTFTQSVTADGTTDITGAEAETLTDGSNADLLHTHAASGGGISFAWKFDNGTTSGPANGDIRYDNATPASVTNLYVSQESDNGVDLSSILTLLVIGNRVYVQQEDDATKFLLATISGTPVDNGTDWTIPVTVDDSGTLPQNNRVCRTIFAGGSATGDVVGPASATDNAVARYDLATGKLIQDSNVIIDDNDDVTGVRDLSVRSVSFSGDMSQSAWGMLGIKVSGSGLSTLTDTSSSGTVAQATTVVLSQGTIAASSATTFTDYYGAYAYEPVEGTNVTMTDKWALGADSFRVGAFGGDNFVTITSDGTFRASALDPFANDWFYGKGFVHLASTANIDITTDFKAGTVIDGVAIVTGWRILLKDQTNAEENGIFIVAASAPASVAAGRAADANTWAELENILVHTDAGLVASGTTNKDKTFRTYDNIGGTLETTPLLFEEYMGPNRIGFNLNSETEVSSNLNGFFAGWSTGVNGIIDVTGETEYVDRATSTATAVSANPCVNYAATTKVTGTNGWNAFGSGFLFWAQGKHLIESNTGNMGPFYTLVAQMVLENGSTGSKIQFVNADILLDTTLKNSSTGTYTINDYNSIQSGITVEGSNATIASFRNIICRDATEVSGGTVTNQAGLCVQNLTAATNKSLLLLGTDTISSGNYCINQDGNTYVNRFNAGMRFKQRTVSTATVTITTADDLVICSHSAGVVTANIPDATTCEGLELTIKRTGTQIVNVTSSGGQTFDGAASPLAIATIQHLVVIRSDGANWVILKTGAP